MLGIGYCRLPACQLRMITDVPTTEELRETGIGWLHLAWETAIQSMRSYVEHVEYYDEFVKDNSEDDDADEALPVAQQVAFWSAQRFKLNNALSLLQQSMEILLKSRIAATSPYLLIDGSVPTSGKDVSFDDLKTIGAAKLCGVVATVSGPLPPGFVDFFERVRKQRNRIAHLREGTLRLEVGSILKDILEGYAFLFPGERWLMERRRFLIETEGPLQSPSDDNPTHSVLLGELRLVIEAIDAESTMRFFHYDKSSGGLRCPNCQLFTASWDDVVPSFAFRTQAGKVECAACEATYEPAEYEREAAESFR